MNRSAAERFLPVHLGLLVAFASPFYLFEYFMCGSWGAFHVILSFQSWREGAPVGRGPAPPGRWGTRGRCARGSDGASTPRASPPSPSVVNPGNCRGGQPVPLRGGSPAEGQTSVLPDAEPSSSRAWTWGASLCSLPASECGSAADARVSASRPRGPHGRSHGSAQRSASRSAEPAGTPSGNCLTSVRPDCGAASGPDLCVGGTE